MSLGLIGRKVGMTRIFTEDGLSIPVSIIEATPNRVTQVKTGETDGYNAVQVAAGTRKANSVNKAQAGHFAKANVEAGRVMSEFRLDGEISHKPGDEITVAIFEAGQMADVTGQSKGKGFQGVIKRYNFAMQDATHGNSLSHRAPGSIGQCQTPGRVWKGKKMAGHMGSERVTTQNLEVVRVDVERNLIMIKGAVPGATGSHIIVKPAVKG
jgi:large subunit ribosomal protein L3